MSGIMLRQGSNVLAVGNLTRDPEQRETSQSGKTPPVKASIAVGSGENTRFLNLIAWHEAGEDLMTAQKGDKVRIYGEEKDASYVSQKSGDTVERKEITCEWVDVKSKNRRRTAEPAPAQYIPSTDTEIEDDMPF